MSHVVAGDAVIDDDGIKLIEEICVENKWVFNRGAQTYKWFGTHVGDYPLPEGMKASDMGKCSHSISVPGSNYEVGLVKDASTGLFKPIFDFYGVNGKVLEDAMGGKKAEGLIQKYNFKRAEKIAKEKKYKMKHKTVGKEIHIEMEF